MKNGFDTQFIKVYFENANFTGMIFWWFLDHHNFARNSKNQKSFYNDII